MEIDRTRLDAEEAWVAKYRAALKAPPIHQSRLMKVRVALESAHNILVSHIEGILERIQTRRRRPAPSSERVLIPEPQTLTRKMNRAEWSGKQPSKKVG
jgi:hypothetical protein